MISQAMILASLHALPPCWADRDFAGKSTQLETVATAIAGAINRTKWAGNELDFAAALVTIGYFESRYCSSVHRGDRVTHAAGLFQVHPQSHKVSRSDLIGLSPAETQSSANIAARVLAKSWRCGGTPRGWFSAYRGGVACSADWETLQARVRTFGFVRGRMARVREAS